MWQKLTACIHLKIQLASKKPANRQRREEVADDILAVIGGRKAKRKELKHMVCIFSVFSGY